MSAITRTAQSVWPDVLRLLCYGLMIAILFGFLGGKLPIGDSLAIFRIELTAALALCASFVFRSGRILVPALALTTCLASVVSILPFAIPDPQPERVDFRLHQHNVLYGNRELAHLIEQVRAVDADILTFQEVSETNFGALKEGLGAEYPHYQVCLYSKGGVAVMMRDHGALIDYGCLPKSRLAWMRVETASGPFTVGSLHQIWPWPMGQFWQQDVYAEEIAALAGPVILGGDFNNVPWSAAVVRVARAAQGRLAAGLGRSFLFATPWPRFRIDHVIVPTGAVVRSELSPAWGSDHLGVTAEIMLPR